MKFENKLFITPVSIVSWKIKLQNEILDWWSTNSNCKYVRLLLIKLSKQAKSDVAFSTGLSICIKKYFLQMRSGSSWNKPIPIKMYRFGPQNVPVYFASLFTIKILSRFWFLLEFRQGQRFRISISLSQLQIHFRGRALVSCV